MSAGRLSADVWFNVLCMLCLCVCVYSLLCILCECVSLLDHSLMQYVCVSDIIAWRNKPFLAKKRFILVQTSIVALYVLKKSKLFYFDLSHKSFILKVDPIITL